jgi:hypothetical protein
MTVILLLAHLLAFAAPALGVGFVLWLGLRLRRAGRLGRGAQLALLAGGGVLVLLAGLIAFGRDGRIATYAALVLVQGSLAWWLSGSARTGPRGR